MRRTILVRSLVVLASTIVVVVGCSETPTEGDLPPAKGVATPADTEALQKKLLAEKVSGGAQYKAPPGVQIPKR